MLDRNGYGYVGCCFMISLRPVWQGILNGILEALLLHTCLQLLKPAIHVGVHQCLWVASLHKSFSHVLQFSAEELLATQVKGAINHSSQNPHLSSLGVVEIVVDISLAVGFSDICLSRTVSDYDYMSRGMSIQVVQEDFLSFLLSYGEDVVDVASEKFCAIDVTVVCKEFFF
ncbi:hypothetical protein M514_26326 [Trichuris suis]|uniref:Uncharacterized protein n=1 Tax=Trichuris suis TaxID=68888 RepID=A0A085MWB7_9BILA|nr:hypothetical protein M514_26326 [Trichuris suis]